MNSYIRKSLILLFAVCVALPGYAQRNVKKGKAKPKAKKTAVVKQVAEPEPEVVVEKVPREFEGVVVYERENYSSMDMSGLDYNGKAEVVRAFKGNRVHEYDRRLHKHTVYVVEDDVLSAYTYYDMLKEGYIDEFSEAKTEAMMESSGMTREVTNTEGEQTDTIARLACTPFTHVETCTGSVDGQAISVTTTFEAWNSTKFLTPELFYDYEKALTLKLLVKVESSSISTFTMLTAKSVTECTVADDLVEIPDDIQFKSDPSAEDRTRIAKASKDALREQLTDTKDLKTYLYEKDTDWEE